MSSKRILILNGPNLNLLGQREPAIYGKVDFETYFHELELSFPNLSLEYFQSNVEGEIINKLHEVGFDRDGIVLNAGGYTHTSVAIGDAVSAITTPVMEVHISNVYAREEFRQVSLMAKHCVGVVAGLGLFSYHAALAYFASV